MGGVAFVLCFPKTGFVAAASSTVNANAIVTVHLPPDADILDDFDDTDDQNFWDGVMESWKKLPAIKASRALLNGRAAPPGHLSSCPTT